MRNDDCAGVLPLLPEWIRGESEGEEGRRVGSHVEGCSACRAEADLLRALAATRPDPPPELAGRIKRALRDAGEETRSAPVVWWEWTGLAPRVAAAAAVLVLAASVLLLPGEDAPGGDADGVQLALEAVSNVWLSDDGMVAGAPLLGDLTEEELMALLEEMEP